MLSKTVRINAASAVMNYLCPCLKNYQICKVSTASSMEQTRCLFLDTGKGFTVPQTSAAFTATATVAEHDFLEQSLFPKVYYYSFSKKSRHNGETRTGWKNNVINHLSGLFNSLKIEIA